jgi:hypothetical protein
LSAPAKARWNGLLRGTGLPFSVDFVLTGDEVNPVTKALRANGIDGLPSTAICWMSSHGCLAAFLGQRRSRRIGNFIAGMTRPFCHDEHQRFFDSTPDLR